jgi:mRNA-degrading endonuclease toxin of MazEF toxin-antitoxin module
MSFSNKKDMYKQGDIIIVPYPFSDDLKKYKYRPAIVISNQKSNDLDDDLLICPITSAIRENEFSYQLEDKDTDEALPVQSEVRCNKIVTIRKSLIKRKFNNLKQKTLLKVIQKVKSSF